jgi:hypothetical protein
MGSLLGTPEQLLWRTSSNHQRTRVQKLLHFAFLKFNVKCVTDDVLRTNNTSFLMLRVASKKIWHYRFFSELPVWSRVNGYNNSYWVANARSDTPQLRTISRHREKQFVSFISWLIISQYWNNLRTSVKYSQPAHSAGRSFRNQNGLRIFCPYDYSHSQTFYPTSSFLSRSLSHRHTFHVFLLPCSYLRPPILCKVLYQFLPPHNLTTPHCIL